MSNKNIGAFLNKNFIKDKNHHRFAVLWASKFYKTLNKIMYNKSLDEIKETFPYTFYYIRNYIRYFYSHGRFKDQFIDEYPKLLFRGITKDFEISKTLKQTAFMSTSWDIKIAEHFAEDKGSVLIFNPNNLPDNIPIIIINEDIADHLNEKEILFLPYCSIHNKPIIEQKTKKFFNKHLKKYDTINFFSSYITYSLNEIKKFSEIKKYIHKHKMLGGSKKKHVPFDKFFYDLLKPVKSEIPDYTLDNKIIFFYRAIKDRPVEILKQYNSPKDADETEMYKFTKFKLDKDGYYYDNITNFIPEVQDLKKYLGSSGIFNDPTQETKRNEAREKLDSYNVYTAIYDPINKKIDDLYYGVFKFMYKEYGVDESRNEEIEKAIHNRIKEDEEFYSNHPELDLIDDLLDLIKNYKD